jgi:peptidoglycan/xylan/chitin deacetylase (PgdA/CDA1 family)
MRIVLALLLAFVTLGAAPSWGGVPILMYHKVDPVTPNDPVGRSLTISPRDFEEQLAWLRAHHIRTITTADLVADLAKGEHPSDVVVLTFDDGYTDGATVVTPLLRKFGDVATFYVSAGFVGDGRHMSWSQLRAMHAAGMEIGCHGTFHRDLTTLSHAQASYEVGHCAAALARWVGRPTTYAYAAGRYDAFVSSLVQHDGFRVALTEHPGAAESLTDPYAWPRRRIAHGEGLPSFAALATP